jgi:WD40 repeat protein
MFALFLLLDAALPQLLDVPAEPPALVVSGEALPPGAIARFGIPHRPFPNYHYPFTAGYSDEGSFRVAVGDGKDVRVWTWHAATTQPPKHLFAGHAEDVTRLVLSPDGRTLATADRGGAVRVCDLASGDTLLTLKTASGVRGLAVSPRGRHVFVPGRGGFAVWDTTTGKSVAEGGGARVFVAAAFSPDGKQVAAADESGKLDLWEVASGKRVGELAWTPKPPPKNQGPLGPKLGPGGRPEVPMAEFGMYYVVNPISPEHDGGVIRIAFTADGKRVLAGGATVVRAWDAESRKELWVSSHSHYHTTLGNATGWVTDYHKLSGMDVSPDGKYAAITDVSGNLRLKDAATGKDVWVKPKVAGGGVVGVAFHPNGKWLTTHAAGDVADLWDIRTGARVATTGGHTAAAWGVAFSPDGKYLASFGEDRFLDAVDLARGRVAGRAYVGIGGMRGLGFTANGRYVVTGPAHPYGSFGVVEFTPGPRAGLTPLKLGGLPGSFGALCIDPRAPARVLGARGGQAVHATDIPGAKYIGYGDGTEGTLILPNDTPYHVALAAEANRVVIASGPYGKPALVFDLKTGKQPITLDGEAYGVAVTPDGKLIAGVSLIDQGGPGTRQLCVWDGETGKRKFTIDFPERHGGPPTFSPDGKRIAVGAAGELVLIDSATGEIVGRVKGHRGTTWGVAFSPDGKRIATCADDGQTLLWDVAKIPAPPRP